MYQIYIRYGFDPGEGGKTRAERSGAGLNIVSIRSWKIPILYFRYIGMENETQEPVEQTTVEQTIEEQPAETAPQQQDVADTGNKEVRKNSNWDNGRRRIAHRESMKARMRELENRIAELTGDDDTEKREALQDRLDDMMAIANDDTAQSLEDHASRFFGEMTPQFMQNVYRYSGYVNRNEPSLLKYVQRDYGPILLHEWMKRMDQPQLRNEWLQMTPYEKDRVLDGFYTEIKRIIHGSGQKQNVPVPNGGRQTPSSEPTNDIGIELGRALARHGDKR